LTNSAWRILADFYIRSGGFEKNHLATLRQQTADSRLLTAPLQSLFNLVNVADAGKDTDEDGRN
jgi:hypothetical protein